MSERGERTRPDSVIVTGLKACANRTEVEFAPLTVFSGANSAGKSTMMQGMLLLKQTVEAPYDPGPVLLSGPHYEWNRASQLLSKRADDSPSDQLSIGFKLGEWEAALEFGTKPNAPGLWLQRMIETNTRDRRKRRIWKEGMTNSEIERRLPPQLQSLTKMDLKRDVVWSVERDHCLLDLTLHFVQKAPTDMPLTALTTGPANAIRSALESLIHLPALRGNPARTYPSTSLGPVFSGPFQPYTASLIESWLESQSAEAAELAHWLRTLGLAAAVRTSRANDSDLQVTVARSRYADCTRDSDWVDIADTGFGMSQSLPILVALIAARRGQMVYIEQPEIHLHPKAQLALVALLAQTVRRGVRVVVETHSRLTLTGIQTLVATGGDEGLAPEDVALYWFRQEPSTGYTAVTRGQLDAHGRYGSWPQDFAQTSLQAEHDFLVASLRHGE